MASIGFAVGLGNIWRFPYVTGENGGSAFVIVYLACAFGIGVPILMAEIMVGRRGGLTPPASMDVLARQSGCSPAWAWVGRLNLLTAFSILAAYTVVAGWVFYYLFLAITGGFAGMDGVRATDVFTRLLSNVPALVFWSTLALVLACGVVFAGVRRGIERAVVVLMPLLFLLLLSLVVFNVLTGGMPQALTYLFTPDFSKLSPGVLLAAVGQAFFSIGVAMAGMMMFGAYLPRRVSIGASALMIVTADTGVALLAGLVIFPMVFHNGLDPAGGTGLIFQTLPVAFAHMPAGGVVSLLFFLLLSVAAVTSMVGLAEPINAWIAERMACSRQRATMVLLAVAGVVSIASVLSYNHRAQVTVSGFSLTEFIDFMPNQVFLPLGGLLIALFVGWFVKAEHARQELALGRPQIFLAWRSLLRFVVVPAVGLILITGLYG